MLTDATLDDLMGPSNFSSEGYRNSWYTRRLKPKSQKIVNAGAP